MTYGEATCDICPHHCALDEGLVGQCRARLNRGGAVVSGNYGLLSAMALDPIEKKPLHRFYPGSRILSVGSFGCNLRCPFCQNNHISMVGPPMEAVPPFVDAEGGRLGGSGVSNAGVGAGGQGTGITPEQLVEAALAERSRGNIGLAFTYNEPLVGYEFVLDCAKLSAEAGLRNVLVTNGYICEEPLRKLLPYIHGMNIDLKGFRESYYAKLGGDLETVKETIRIANDACHVEITTLIVPGENDSEEEILALAAWLADMDEAIPYHVSRFFPRWQMSDREATSVSKVYALAGLARKYLRYVYEGNC